MSVIKDEEKKIKGTKYILFTFFYLKPYCYTLLSYVQ